MLYRKGCFRAAMLQKQPPCKFFLKPDLRNGSGRTAGKYRGKNKKAMKLTFMKDLFDKLSLYYDHMVNWQERFAREGPFFLKTFEENNVKSILDCACGTGKHVLYFIENGFSASGCDIGKDVLKMAKKNAESEGISADFFYADMTKLDKFTVKKYNAVISIGNSLALLNSKRALLKAFSSIASVLEKGGVFIFQSLNFERMKKHKEARFSLKSTNIEGKDILFIKVFDLGKRYGALNILTIPRLEKGWQMETQSKKLSLFNKKDIKEALQAAGFKEWKFYGDYKFSPYSEEDSIDIIGVARL